MLALRVKQACTQPPPTHIECGKWRVQIQGSQIAHHHAHLLRNLSLTKQATATDTENRAVAL
jgi:hypothetical protein